MGTPKKTTIELSDKLLNATRKFAAAVGVPVRELVKRGLGQVVVEAKRPSASFMLRKVGFKDKGLRPELQGVSCDRLRDWLTKGAAGDCVDTNVLV